MKILMLTPYLPYPLVTGGQTRSYNLIKRLAGLGHKITLFCLVKNDEEKKNIHELEKFCQEVQVFKRSEKPWTLKNILRTGFSFYPFLVIRNWAVGERSAINKRLENEEFDLIHAETFYVMPHIPDTNVPIVLVDQTIEYEVYQHYVDNYKWIFVKPLLYLDVSKMKFWEVKYWKKARKVVAMSEEDRKIMHTQVPKLNVGIVPNGVDSNFFSNKIYDKPKNPVVLYLGNFTWLQNREAVEVLVKKVWPIIKKRIQGVSLWIIGKDAEYFFGKMRSVNIRVDEVSDPREAYQQAWVLAAPIYGAGGTRYKNFEAFASGLPVVTTSIGIGGTDVRNGYEVIIKDEPGEIAEAVIELIKNPKLHQKISKNAKDMVEQKYDWGPIALELNKIYQEVRK